MSLYDDYSRLKPQFDSLEDALQHFLEDFAALTIKHEMKDMEFWNEAEHASVTTDDYRDIMNLYRKICACRSLIEKKKNE